MSSKGNHSIKGRSLTRSYISHSITQSHAYSTHSPDALFDVPAWWRDAITDSPSDTCLRTNATQLGPSGGLPRLIFLDVWHRSVGEIITNYKITLGAVHSATGFRMSVRMRLKSQAPEALAVILAYFTSVGRPVRWIHTDGARELKGAGMFHVSHPASTSYELPLQSKEEAELTDKNLNGECMGHKLERRARSLAYHIPSFVGHGIMWKKEVRFPPSRSPSYDCPLGRLVKDKPAGAHRRPFGCLCCVRVAQTYPGGGLVNKLAEQGVCAIHLGYGGRRARSFEGLSS